MLSFTRYLLFPFLFVYSFHVHAQLPIGQWREHYSYRSAHDVTEGAGKIYCTTTGGLFSYNPSDNSLERMSKVTGLSDIEASCVKYNDYNGVLVIAYKNTNIDLIKNGRIINISDIRRKSMSGNKTINNILFINQYAYLSCGFGIVLLDTEKEEIKETYYIGPNGQAINVYELAKNGTSLFAATENGIFEADLNDPNLVNYGAWKKHAGLPAGVYNTITGFDGKIFANFSRNQTYKTYLQDTIFVYDGANWSIPALTKDDPKSIKSSGDFLIVTCEWYVVLYDKSFSVVKLISDYGFSSVNFPKDAILDHKGMLWIADLNYGLVRVTDEGKAQSIFPNGPAKNSSFDMKTKDGHVWVAPSGTEPGTIFLDGIFHYYNGEWKNLDRTSNQQLDTIFSLNCIEIDPDDPAHVYVGSNHTGLVEVRNDDIAFVYNDKNTGGALQNIQGLPGYYSLRVVGLDHDENKNLWIALSVVSKCMAVRKTDGTWQNFDFSPFVQAPRTGKLLVNQWNQKWLIIPNGGGILLFDDQGTFAQPDVSNTKKLSSAKGNGGLPSNEVQALAEDHDGEIWVGTNKGIAVFYTPESIFSGGTDWDAQQILIQQDGHTQILLETELINAISIDGANRKWIGTQNSGVFLMSADGTKQINHFTDENSPLPSNEINGIAIDGKSGEVFFGTAKGIISYRSDATEGEEEFREVYAYPNPVRENYSGPVAIKGLVKNASVKITDISGNLVYETRALGGQAIWEVKNFSGERVKSGVYLVFCANEDGSETHVTKIMVIN